MALRNAVTATPQQLCRERLLAGRSEDEYFADAVRIGPYRTLMGGMAFECGRAVGR
ncbi:hypothetical protein [Streptomyces blattellae]|uniref:hypothetical protein n=1 Tax=Streptomyces blattellae TaxID=2569855 RepID=UPI0012B7FB12